MNATQQREHCPVKIRDTYKGGKVIYILGDSKGWNVWTKHERIGTASGLIDMPVHREVLHRIEC